MSLSASALLPLVALSLVPTAAATPEDVALLVDARGDAPLAGLADLDVAGASNADLLAVRSVEQTPEAWVIAVTVAGDGAPSALLAFDYSVGFSVAGRALTATAHLAPQGVLGNGTLTAGGVAEAASFTAGVLTLRLARDAFGPDEAPVVRDLVVRAQARPTIGPAIVQDRAPDAGVGQPYALRAEPTGPTEPVPQQEPASASTEPAVVAALAASSAVTASQAVRRLRP